MATKFINSIKVFVGFFLFLGIALSCENNDHEFQSTALITGTDLRYCMCCGGYLITLEDSTFNFDSLPSASGIDLTTETFPVAVELDWSYDKKCGSIQYIKIERIEKQ